MVNPNVYYIFYGDKFLDTKKYSLSDAGGFFQILQEFMKNLDGSPYWSIHTSYYDYAGTYGISNIRRYLGNQITYGGGVIVPSSWDKLKTHTPPFSLDPSGSSSFGSRLSNPNSLTNGNDVISIILHAFAYNILTFDSNGIYVVITDPSITMNGPMIPSNPNATTSGFHSQFSTRTTVVNYAWVRDWGPQCDLKTGLNFTGWCFGASPNGNPEADWTIFGLTHELSETMVFGWGANTAEGADRCRLVLNNEKYDNTMYFKDSTGARYNVTLKNGKNYYASALWVNLTGPPPFPSPSPSPAPSPSGYCSVGAFPPTAQFVSSPTLSALSTHAIQFNGSSSVASDGGTLTYYWIFGDGTTGVGVNPVHPYNKAGTYHVRLTVIVTNPLTGTVTDTTSANGFSGSVNQSVTVQ